MARSLRPVDTEDFHGGLDFFFDDESDPKVRSGKLTVVRDQVDDTCVFSFDADSGNTIFYESYFVCEAGKMGMNGPYCGFRYYSRYGWRDETSMTIELFGCERKSNEETFDNVKDWIPRDVITIPNISQKDKQKCGIFSASRVASHYVQLAIVAGGEGYDTSHPAMAMLNGFAQWYVQVADTLGMSKAAWYNGGDFSSDTAKANANYASIVGDHNRELTISQADGFNIDIVEPMKKNDVANRSGRRLKDEVTVFIFNPINKCGNPCFGRCGVNCDCWSWICGSDCKAYKGCYEHDCYCSCISIFFTRCVGFVAHPKTCNVVGCAAFYCQKSAVDHCHGDQLRRLQEEYAKESPNEVNLPVHPENYQKMVLTGNDWETYKAQCNDYEYEWKLSINRHIYMLLKPTERASQSGCGPLVMHADVPEDDHYGDFIKRVFKPTSEETMMLFGDGWENGLFPHYFSFNRIAHAFDAADVNPSGTLKTNDIVLNNCGDFVMEVARSLDIIKSFDISMIANALLKHGGDLLMLTSKTVKSVC